MKIKCTIKKYDGDDIYSYAVFKSADVKGLGNIIMYGQAKPLVCGLGRYQATVHKKQLELGER